MALASPRERYVYVVVQPRPYGPPGDQSTLYELAKEPRHPTCYDFFRAWKDGTVGLGQHGTNKSDDLRMHFYFRDRRADGGEVVEAFPIDYCPWCGAQFLFLLRGDGA